LATSCPKAGKTKKVLAKTLKRRRAMLFPHKFQSL
jgi:hypothetical protein